MDINPFIILRFMKGSSITFNVPDNGRILHYLSKELIAFEVINQNKKSIIFAIEDENVEIAFDVKNTLYLDAILERYKDKINPMPKVNFRTEINSIEIIPCINFNTIIHKFNSDYRISISKGISISSPTPEYLEDMFDSGTIKFSGICVYLNEEGKSLCGSKNSKSIIDAQKEDINANIVVITTGIDTTFSIPSSWTKEHYLYFIKPDSVSLDLSDISELSYYSDGIKVKEKCTIIAGNFTIYVPTKLTYKVDLPKGYPLYSYMYYCYLNCGKNEQTNLYLEYLSGNQIYKAAGCLNIGGYDSTHKLTFYINNEEDVEELLNLANLYGDSEGLDIKQNDDKRYFCICKDESCDKCKEGIEGTVITHDSINSDPGKDVDIRIFMNIEVSSDVFSNDHNVYINSLNNLIVKEVQNVNQKVIENKLKVDNLIFSNANNLIIKPKQPILNITMAKQNAGLDFTIEISDSLILSVQNANENGIVASKINVKGNGELNIYDYPYEKIEAESTIKVIKGIYIICNSKVEGASCSYDTIKGYKVIDSYDDFSNKLDKDSKILVILDSYSGILDVDINRLSHQQLMITNEEISLSLLKSYAKVRFLSTTILTNKADLTTNLESSQGGVSLSNDESNFYIVAFNDKLIIKQEGNINTDLNPIVIQPQSEKASIVIDKNVNLENQKLKIETENEKLDLTVFVGDKKTNGEFIESDKNKVKVTIKEGAPDDKPPKKDGLKTGEIIGIVIGVVAFVAIMIVVVIIIIKKKKNNDHSSTEASDQE